MKFSFVILLVPHIWAVREEYKGFSNCNIDGWRCKNHFNRYSNTITYDCSQGLRTPNARLWTWTARLPSEVTEFIICNCNHLEIHMDCTTGTRSNNLRILRLVNITSLDILPPSRRGEYLHDNAAIPQVPDTFYLENISSTSFYKGLFHHSTEQCQFSDVRMNTMILKNVNIKSVDKEAFANKMDQLQWSGVTVDKMDVNSMVIEGNISITDSTFSVIPTHSIRLKGNSVRFSGNKIERILPSGITVHSNSFKFSNNSIQDIKATGLMVWSSYVSLQGNAFHNLGVSALEGITPAYYASEQQVARKPTYEFLENKIDLLGSTSLHNNWKAYSEACSRVTVERNIINCTCKDLYWFTFVNAHKEAEEFYRKFLNSTNFCRQSADCKLSEELVHTCKTSESTDPCSKLIARQNHSHETDNTTTSIGPNPNATEIPRVTSSPEYVAPTLLTINLTSDPKKEAEDIDYMEKIISSNDSYYHDRSSLLSEPPQEVFPVWIVVLVVGVLIAAAASIVLVWWMQKRKKSSEVRSVCTYTVNTDTDKLIMNVKSDAGTNECHNMLFQN